MSVCGCGCGCGGSGGGLLPTVKPLLTQAEPAGDVCYEGGD